MAERFLKLMNNNNTLELTKRPNLLSLITLIAIRAKRTDDISINGLEIGEAFIGDYKNCGLTQQEYRTAKDTLSRLHLVSFKATNKGTVAKLMDKRIFDINEEVNNEQTTNKQQTDNEQTTTNKKERNKELKEIYKEKKEDTVNPYWDAFKGVCLFKNIEIEMTERRFMELREEFYTKLVWFVESKSCVEWCYDKGLKKINIQRLRNWMKNALKFQKDKEIKQQQSFQDKKFAPQPKILSASQIPVWTPPL